MTARERPWADDIAEAGRRDAELAGEFDQQPDSHRTEPWFVPRRSDWENR